MSVDQDTGFNQPTVANKAATGGLQVRVAPTCRVETWVRRYGFRLAGRHTSCWKRSTSLAVMVECAHCCDSWEALHWPRVPKGRFHSQPRRTGIEIWFAPLSQSRRAGTKASTRRRSLWIQARMSYFKPRMATL